jgi:hypothetical protein
MNPLEDRLHEYASTNDLRSSLSTGLAQFDDEPMPALSLRRLAYHDRLLMDAGIVPTNPIELPRNLTRNFAPQLLNNLIKPGDNLMDNQTTPSPSPTRVRIHSHVTQSRFLHVEDALNIGQGKIRLFAGRYRKGHGMDDQGYAHHFIDLADARVIFWALLWGEQGFSHKEYKGTPPSKGSGNGAVSRVLSIAVKGENVYIELKMGPGKLTNTGAITPNGPAKVEVNVAFKLHEARRMAATVLAYIRAWDVLRILAHKQIVGQPAPYATTPLSTSLLVATSSEQNGVPNMTTKPENSVAQANGTGKLQTSMANGRPVTRKDVVKPNGVAANPTNGKSGDKQPMHYGSGEIVDGKNLTEVQTFQRYVVEKKTAPESKTVLLDYYRHRIQPSACIVD